MSTTTIHQDGGNGKPPNGRLNKPWREILQSTAAAAVTITHEGRFVARLAVGGETLATGRGLFPRDALNRLNESLGWYAHQYDMPGGITVDDYAERMCTGRYEQ